MALSQLSIVKRLGTWVTWTSYQACSSITRIKIFTHICKDVIVLFANLQHSQGIYSTGRLLWKSWLSYMIRETSERNFVLRRWFVGQCTLLRAIEFKTFSDKKHCICLYTSPSFSYLAWGAVSDPISMHVHKHTQHVMIHQPPAWNVHAAYIHKGNTWIKRAS